MRGGLSCSLRDNICFARLSQETSNLHLTLGEVDKAALKKPCSISPSYVSHKAMRTNLFDRRGGVRSHWLVAYA